MYTYVHTKHTYVCVYQEGISMRRQHCVPLLLPRYRSDPHPAGRIWRASPTKYLGSETLATAPTPIQPGPCLAVTGWRELTRSATWRVLRMRVSLSCFQNTDQIMRIDNRRAVLRSDTRSIMFCATFGKNFANAFPCVHQHSLQT